MILETRGVKANAECVKNVEGLEACCLKFLISQHFRAVFSKVPVPKWPARHILTNMQ